jgi:hypothetical protein
LTANDLAKEYWQSMTQAANQSKDFRMRSMMNSAILEQFWNSGADVLDDLQ